MAASRGQPSITFTAQHTLEAEVEGLVYVEEGGVVCVFVGLVGDHADVVRSVLVELA